MFFFVGTTLFTFYNLPGAGGFPQLFRQDQLLPFFVSTELPIAGLTGVIIAGLFAAALSTIDSGINSLTAVFVFDWLGGKNVSIRTSRILSVVCGFLVIGAALVSPFLGQHLIEIVAKIVGVFLGLLLGVFLLGMFVPRANAAGAFIGLAALRSGSPCLPDGSPACRFPLPNGKSCVDCSANRIDRLVFGFFPCL
jgi:Na+/proline symporter